MKALRFLVLVPAWFLLVAAASPTPTPQPNANIVLDTAAGGANTKITVNGTQFLAHEDVTLYWDSPNKVAAKVTTDRNGAFTTTVTPYPGDRVELHNLCASVRLTVANVVALVDSLREPTVLPHRPADQYGRRRRAGRDHAAAICLPADHRAARFAGRSCLLGAHEGRPRPAASAAVGHSRAPKRAARHGADAFANASSWSAAADAAGRATTRLTDNARAASLLGTRPGRL
jgi:hypothetical protein